MKILSKKNTDYQEIPISISSPEFSYIKPNSLKITLINFLKITLINFGKFVEV
jgi:hypothetical protein